MYKQLTTAQKAWLGGLISASGTVTIKRDNVRNKQYIKIVFSSQDWDILDKVRQLLECDHLKITYPEPTSKLHTRKYYLSLTSIRIVPQLLRDTFRYLSTRNQEKGQEFLIDFYQQALDTCENIDALKGTTK